MDAAGRNTGGDRAEAPSAGFSGTLGAVGADGIGGAGGTGSGGSASGAGSVGGAAGIGNAGSASGAGSVGGAAGVGSAGRAGDPGSAGGIASAVGTESAGRRGSSADTEGTKSAEVAGSTTSAGGSAGSAQSASAKAANTHAPSLEGKVAVVTGAGAGLGRAEALALAREGAAVVVNDIEGSAGAADVVAEIESGGGKALAVTGDVSEASTAKELLSVAVDHFGSLDIVVNNAGVLRDRMLFSMSDADWDKVIAVHLRGHFLLSRNAAAYWRDRSKVEGQPVYGRLVNTASEAFLVGSPGQPNYSAAKAGIAALTMSAARGLAKYGVRANTICPRARTAMTADVFGEAPKDGLDPLSVEHVAPFVAFLASPKADGINGQVFVVHGGMVALLQPPSVEARFDTAHGSWTTDELAGTVGAHFADRDPERMFAATDLLSLP